LEKLTLSIIGPVILADGQFETVCPKIPPGEKIKIVVKMRNTEAVQDC
jgi:hypothetical protein